jgi:hypothetical protein
MSVRLALAANFTLIGFLVLSGWLQWAHSSVYYAAAQEDQALEWASFWSFFLAGFAFAAAARRQRTTARRIPWFLAGLALFCVFVAMEEISWGQRVLGHMPPEYFLAENYQQELNVHNIAGRSLRVWTFRGIILGYGVVLPLLALIPGARRTLDRLAVVPPPVELAPAMFAIFWIHLQYPWKFTGEITECALGFAFLFASMVNAADLAEARSASSLARAASLPVLAVALGIATAAWSQNRQSWDPSYVERAEAETRALANDFATLAKKEERASITKCGLHKRLYTFAVEKHRARDLAEGTFAGLTAGGMPEERAEYFLDPWNYPYWIRDRCDDDTGRRSVFIYSFGPNRSRDSSRWEIRGDDVGVFVVRRTHP